MNIARNCITRLRKSMLSLVAAAFLCTLTTVAYAIPLNFTLSQPDILVSDLELSYDNTNFSAKETSLSWFEPPAGSSLSIANGTYSLNTLTNSFLVGGNLGGGSITLLEGTIAASDLDFSNNIFRFLIDLTSFEPTLGSFGDTLGVIITASTFANGAGYGNSDNGNVAPVPEPGTFALLGIGLAGAYLYRRKSR